MENDFIQKKEFLTRKAEIQARLNHLPYNGRPEVKDVNDGQYIYVRRREAGRNISEYVDVYNDALFAILQTQWKERKTLNKELKSIEKKLVALGYFETELSPQVARNLEFARINLKYNIYDQAILEGVDTTLPDTETILENGRVNGMTVSDIQKILNLKHAWDFVLDNDVIQAKSDYSLLCHIASLVNENLIPQGGWIRTVPVRIGGSSYVPVIPNEIDVKENIQTILSSPKDDIDKSIDLCLYCMKTQIFKDGNKRASVIFANHYLMSKGEGLLVIPADNVPEFKKLLIDYYEDKDLESIKTFMKEKSWHRFENKQENKIAVAEKLSTMHTTKERKKLDLDTFNPKNDASSLNSYVKQERKPAITKNANSKKEKNLEK